MGEVKDEVGARIYCVKCDCKAFAASLSFEITFVEVSAQGPQLIVAIVGCRMMQTSLHVGAILACWIVGAICPWASAVCRLKLSSFLK